MSDTTYNENLPDIFWMGSQFRELYDAYIATDVGFSQISYNDPRLVDWFNQADKFFEDLLTRKVKFEVAMPIVFMGVCLKLPCCNSKMPNHKKFFAYHSHNFNGYSV